MFEIRVICDPADTDRVVAALDATFTTGTVTRYPTRDSKRQRLYVRANHHTDPTTEETDRTEAGPTAWPTPEDAYATAPAIPYEIAWTASTARTLTENPHGDTDREYWLRKAALMDRIALDYEADGVPNGTDDIAANAARRLIEIDHSSDPAALAHPRGYVRHEYAHWADNQ
ncbi:hypothetical protein [Streptomyces sp. B21-083]|uniref:hypothetical protein n=1 Tax=Streptomyces sp. B21-083 TaxID=3039410 RepID=UPI002FF0602A